MIMFFPDMSIDAPPETWIRIAKFLALPLLAFALLLTNYWCPLIRFSNAFANVVTSPLTFLLPFLTAIFAWVIPRRRLTKVIALILLFPLLCLSALDLFLESDDVINTFHTGVDRGFERVASVSMGGYSVGIYIDDCGAVCDHDVVVRQEKTIVPGILLARELSVFIEGYNPTYKVLGENTILVEVPANVDSDPHDSTPARSAVLHLKPYLYF